MHAAHKLEDAVLFSRTDNLPIGPTNRLAMPSWWGRPHARQSPRITREHGQQAAAGAQRRNAQTWWFVHTLLFGYFPSSRSAQFQGLTSRDQTASEYSYSKPYIYILRSIYSVYISRRAGLFLENGGRSTCLGAAAVRKLSRSSARTTAVASFLFQLRFAYTQ